MNHATRIFKRTTLAPFFIACVLSATVFPREARATEPSLVRVDVSKALRASGSRLLGVNVNYLLDDDRNRSRRYSIEKGVAAMGVKSLRYPGGAKSDVTLWSRGDFSRPAPTLARVGPEEWPSNDPRVYDLAKGTWKTHPMDFDAFMRLCRATGAEPVVVLAYDSMYRPATPGARIPDKAELLKNAVSWVRYANVEKKYGVKFWELGNESYLYTYDGGAKAEDYARDYLLFASAMKAVDQNVRLGANGPPAADEPGKLDAEAGNPTPWWKTVFEIAGDDIDFISLHEYPCMNWYGYDYYRANALRMKGLEEVREAARRYGKPGLDQRLRFRLTELNSADWAGHPQNLGWKHENTLGHALALFDMLGQALADPAVDAAQVWATRWMENAVKPELWDALDAHNHPLPTGVALTLWAKNIGDRIVSASSSEPVVAHAAYDARRGFVTVFCVNKDQARPVVLELSGGRFGKHGTATTWSGDGPDDQRPRFSKPKSVHLHNNKLQLNLEPTSLTIVRIPCQERTGLRAKENGEKGIARPKA